MYSSNYKKENRMWILGHHTPWHDNNFHFSSLVGHLVFVVVESIVFALGRSFV